MGGEELAVLARVDGEADKGARAVLQGAFRSPSGHLVSRACFGEGYSDGSRPMVKKVTRLLNQKRDGAVLARPELVPGHVLLRHGFCLLPSVTPSRSR